MGLVLRSHGKVSRLDGFWDLIENGKWISQGRRQVRQSGFEVAIAGMSFLQLFERDTHDCSDRAQDINDY